MRACPRCGTPNPETETTCPACGVALEQPVRSEQPVRPGGLKHTMLGMPSPLAGVGAPAPAPKVDTTQASFPRGTMIGLANPAAPPPPPAGPPASATPAPRQGLKQTMLGFAPPPGLQPQAAVPPPAAAPPAAAPHPLGGTLAIASPPVHSGALQQPPVAAPDPHAAGLRPQKQTMVGIARPGIAPLHPGETRPARPRPAPVAEAPRPAPAPAYVPPEPGPPPAKPAGLPRSAMVLIAVAALLAATAGVVAFLWDSPKPLRAEVVVDDRGGEVLKLTCDDCADGTTVGIGPSRTTFKGTKADLPLAKPLDIGKNTVIVSVHRTGIGRDEEVPLEVGVDYRVRGVLTGLSEDPPKVTVAVQAVPGTAAIVDGRAVTLDAHGNGEYAVDVSKELEGPADSMQPFEKKLPYTITKPGSEARRGDVTIRFAIVPLRVDSPGESIVVDGETFMLGGHTLKDGRVSVSGRPITVDAEGRFAQLMNVSSVGETTIVVRAEAKDLAPRHVRVRVKRVANLREEAARFRQSATDQYANVVAGGSKKGMAVVLDGEAVEARLDGNATVILLDVKQGCGNPPCLARVLYGERFDAQRGAKMSAYGHVRGTVDGPRAGAKIPEVSAEFLLLESKR